MKVKMLKKDLLMGFRGVRKALGRQGTPLPILRHVKFSVGEGAEYATFFGTDLEEAIEYQRPVLSVDEPGDTVLPPSLWGFVRALPKGSEITLTFDDFILFATSGLYSAEFKCEEIKEFPVIHQPMGEPVTLALPGQTLRRMIELVTFAAASDPERPVLTGVQIQYDGKVLMMGAADGFRLSLFRLPLETDLEPFKSIIPVRALDNFVTMIGTRREYVFVDIFEKFLALRLPGYKLSCPPVEGTYPDLDRVIPKNHQVTVTVDAVSLLEACRVVGAVKGPESRLYLNIADEKMALETRREGEGKAQVKLPVDHTGEPLDIVLNVLFLSQVLEAIGPEQVVIEGVAPSTPLVLKVTNDDVDFIHVIMPMTGQG